MARDMVRFYLRGNPSGFLSPEREVPCARSGERASILRR